MHFDIIANEITPILRQTAIETIESDILIISKKINPFKRFKIQRFLSRTKNIQFDNVDLKKVEVYIDSMFKKYTS
jgi:hypothetical protein